MKRKLIVSSMLLIGIASSSYSQYVDNPKPKLWFGVSGAANANFYSGRTQMLNLSTEASSALHDGSGAAPYASVFVEYRPHPVWGAMANIAYDDRSSSFDKVINPGDGRKTTLTPQIRYLSFEPSLRIAPFSNGFYIFLGGTLRYNIDKSFAYNQVQDPKTNFNTAEGDFSEVRQVVYSGQIGAGFDFPLSAVTDRTQVYLSPFISYQPNFGQEPRSIESWTLQTARAGIALKLGSPCKARRKELSPTAIITPVPDNSGVVFTIISPENIPQERRVRETFPIRNYVFFDLGSTQIPSRYVQITKAQVKDFKDDQLEVMSPKKLLGRSDREIVVYHNVLNILGDRMQKIPTATITLVGSSEKGPEDGKLMAESIKKYLVDIFDISPLRVTIEGRDKPKIPSEQPGGKLELELLREGDRRVSIESNTTSLLMEFQKGPDAPLMPVQISTIQEAPLDSYIIFNVDGAKNVFSSWSFEVRDENNTVKLFGPYSREKVLVAGKSILGYKPMGDYNVTMIGQLKKGGNLRKEAKMHIVLWTPPKDEEGMRFSVLYEFNESKTISMYEKYITEIITPKISVNAMVIVHGYTDIIGDSTNNFDLSMARTLDVSTILKSALAKKGRNDVTFAMYGFGEDEAYSPFNNNLPEERFYNRTVIIYIIPQAK